MGISELAEFLSKITIDKDNPDIRDWKPKQNNDLIHNIFALKRNYHDFSEATISFGCPNTQNYDGNNNLQDYNTFNHRAKKLKTNNLFNKNYLSEKSKSHENRYAKSEISSSEDSEIETLESSEEENENLSRRSSFSEKNIDLIDSSIKIPFQNTDEPIDQTRTSIDDPGDQTKTSIDESIDQTRTSIEEPEQTRKISFKRNDEDMMDTDSLEDQSELHVNKKIRKQKSPRKLFCNMTCYIQQELYTETN